jgi:WD40 repeat protein
MGVVWLARERALDRLVALKVAAQGSNPSWSARLLREGKAAASLRHPNVVAVHAMGGEGHAAFVAMEFIEGENLDTRLGRGPLPFREAAAVAEKVAGALSYAHGMGLLHRDIKPSNILIDDDGEPHLADFGLAAPIEGAGDLTLPGHIAGTPAYLAPELLDGSDRASAASDVYGLGAVLYACLAGRAPFVGDSPGSVFAQLRSEDPPRPALLRPGVPRDLETICLKCLEKAPDRRYGSAALLQSDLNAFLDGRPIAARPLGWADRLARSCRRRPALALSVAVAALCLLVLAIGGPLMALRLARAEAGAEDRLREALLARSRATRVAAQIGQRDESLAAVADAARIRPGLDARDEAIAALAQPEIVPIRSWSAKRCPDGAVTFDPDNDRFAIEETPGAVDLRRLSDGGLIRAWRGPSGKLWTYPSFSRDGRRAVARNAKGAVVVWGEERSEPLLLIPDRPYVLTGRFMGYGEPDALSPDGRVLASAIPGSGVSLNSVDDGREIGRIPTESEATHVAFSADGRLVAAGRGLLGRDGGAAYFIRIFDATTLKEVSRPRLEARFQSLAWAPDRDQLLVTGERIDLFGASDGRLLRSLNAPLANRGFFGPSGATILSAEQGGTVTLWDLGAARPLLSGNLGSRVEMAVSRDGELIAKTVGDDEARLVRLEMSRVERTWPAGLEGGRENVLSAAVSTIDFSPDGRWLATAIWGAVQLRDAGGSVRAVARMGTKSNYCSVRFARDGNSLLAGTAEEGLVRIPIVTRGDGGTSLLSPQVIDGETPEFITDVSRDGSRAIVTSFIPGFVKVVTLGGLKGSVRWALPGAAGAAFLDGDREVLANSLDFEGGSKLEVRDSVSGARIGETLPYPRGAHVRVSADGTLIVLGTGESGTVLLHAPDRSRASTLPRQVQGREYQCAISPDGATVAFGVGRQVWLVRPADGSVLAHLQCPQGGTYIPGLAFSPDGARLALWWETGQLTVWDLGRLREELKSRKLDW